MKFHDPDNFTSMHMAAIAREIKRNHKVAQDPNVNECLCPMMNNKFVEYLPECPIHGPAEIELRKVT